MRDEDDPDRSALFKDDKAAKAANARFNDARAAFLEAAAERAGAKLP